MRKLLSRMEAVKADSRFLVDPAISVTTTIWTLSETSASIICVCLTITRTLFRHYKASLAGSIAVTMREPSIHPESSSQNRTLTRPESQTPDSLDEDVESEG